MAEDIYGPNVPHFSGKTVPHKIHHVGPIMVPNFPKGILDKFNKVTLWCDLMHISSIGFMNTIPWRIMFDTGIMIEIRKIKSIEDKIKQVNKI